MIESIDQAPLPEDTNTPQKIGWKRFFVDTIETILLALVLTFGINIVSARVRVENVSMQPTLYQGEFLLVNKMAYKNSLPRTGDIIIFHAPQEPGQDYIKRVIGAPGDRVLIKQGRVSVNDIQLEEDYIADVPIYTGQWDVPKDAVFVLGDNRNSSNDSHAWGFVLIKDVIGKALLRYWPISKVEIFHYSNTVYASP